MKTNWTLKVTEELNNSTFEAAHILKISKSEFIRQAVEEKIQGPLEKKPLEHMESPRYMGASSKLSPDAKEIFNPQPKKGKKQ